MTIADDKKVSILLAALNERYTALHKIRERVQAVGIWAIGLLLVAGGWFLQTDVALSWVQIIVFILGILTAIAAIRFVYLADLRRGFQSQQRVAARLERALGLFTAGEFDSGSDPIYPSSWERAGAKDTDGDFFGSTYTLLYVGSAFLVLCLLHSGLLSIPR